MLRDQNGFVEVVRRTRFKLAEVTASLLVAARISTAGARSPDWIGARAAPRRPGIGHLEVEDDEVRRLAINDPERLPPVFRFV